MCCSLSLYVESESGKQKGEVALRYKNPELMDRIKDFAEKFYMENYRSPSTSEIANATGMVRSAVHRYLIEMDEKGMIEYSHGEISTDKIDKIQRGRGDVFQTAPIVGTVKCGPPEMAEEYVEAYVTLPEALFGKGEFFILRASGESMIEAGINDGDLVVIKQQETCYDGDIVVALVDGENTLKRFYHDWDRECFRLHPENRTMEDIYTRDCRIQGVAVKVLKDIS